MTAAIFVGATLLVPLAGWPVSNRLRIPNVTWAGRLAIAFATGSLLLCAEMLLFSAAGIRWTALRLTLPLLLVALALLRRRRAPQVDLPLPSLSAIPAIAAAIGSIAVLAFATATARITSPDFVAFWGTKGQGFARSGALDVTFLHEPGLMMMHPDYPPLLPFLYSWGALVARHFSWWGALYLTPLFLVATAAAFWGFARPVLGSRKSAELTGLLTTTLTLGYIITRSGGGAEPLLEFFVALSLSLLIFPEPSLETDLLASLSLTGAALTKVEGAAFAALACAAFALLDRRRSKSFRSLIRLGTLPAVALIGWIAFAARNGILESYTRPYGPSSLTHLRKVVLGVARDTSFGIAYIPWVAAGLLLLLSVRSSRALPVIAVTCGYYAFILFCFLHGDFDPGDWIHEAAARLVLTPFTCIVYSVAAAQIGGIRGGALGVSTSLQYPPAPHSKTEGHVALAAEGKL